MSRLNGARVARPGSCLSMCLLLPTCPSCTEAPGAGALRPCPRHGLEKCRQGVGTESLRWRREACRRRCPTAGSLAAAAHDCWSMSARSSFQKGPCAVLEHQLRAVGGQDICCGEAYTGITPEGRRRAISVLYRKNVQTIWRTLKWAGL